MKEILQIKIQWAKKVLKSFLRIEKPFKTKDPS